MNWKTFATITEGVAPLIEPSAGSPAFPGAKSIGRRSPGGIIGPDLEAVAYERGLAEGRLLARGEIEAAAEIHRQQFEAAVEAERERIMDGSAGMLASKLTSAILSIETHIIDQITPVLRHILDAAVVDRALAELGLLLCRAISSDGAFQITVTASQPMIDALKRHLPPGWYQAKFIAGDVADIRVVAEDAELVVDFQKWRHAIAGARL